MNRSPLWRRSGGRMCKKRTHPRPEAEAKEEAEMGLSVRRIVLWRTEVENRTGILAGALKPLAEAGADLQVVMAYRYPGDESKAAIELYPVTTKKAVAAAQAAGLTPSAIPTLLVEGDNKSGLGSALSQAIAGVGINMGFLVTQVIGRKYSCILGFENEEDAKKAAVEIRRVTARKKK